MPINVQSYMTPQEHARAKAEAAVAEEKAQRDMLARKNREEKRPEPKSGDVLIVATANGLRVRGRAGLAFSPTPTEVKVDDVSDDEIKARQKTGEYVVNKWGAEQILADSNGENRGLIVFNTMQEGKAAALESASDEELEAALEARKARREGAPERIKSGRKAEGEGAKTPSEPKSENKGTTKTDTPKG